MTNIASDENLQKILDRSNKLIDHEREMLTQQGKIEDAILLANRQAQVNSKLSPSQP